MEYVQLSGLGKEKNKPLKRGVKGILLFNDLPRLWHWTQYPVDPKQIIVIKLQLGFLIQNHSPHPKYFLFSSVMNVGQIVETEVAFGLGAAEI